MFSNKVTCEWVEATGEEARCNKINEGTNAEGLHQDVVEDKLSQDIEIMPRCQLLGSDEGRSERVEEDLECRKEDLAKDVVQAKQLEAGRKVGINTVFSLMLVVFNVVLLRTM